jgi:hypothetical protein
VFIVRLWHRIALIPIPLLIWVYDLQFRVILSAALTAILVLRVCLGVHFIRVGAHTLFAITPANAQRSLPAPSVVRVFTLLRLLIVLVSIFVA